MYLLSFLYFIFIGYIQLHCIYRDFIHFVFFFSSSPSITVENTPSFIDYPDFGTEYENAIAWQAHLNSDEEWLEEWEAYYYEGEDEGGKI